MSQEFLTKVAADVYRKIGDGVADASFVFPNKRPERYFRNILSATAPSLELENRNFYSIEEFIYRHSALKQTEPLTLLFRLYETWLKYRPNEDFDRFYSWGHMLLADFDEIDRYMAPADKLFGYIKAIKDIEERFQEEGKHELQKRFIQLWGISGKVYQDFRKELQEEGLAYFGMAERELAEKCNLPDFQLKSPWCVFIGFNAISRAEETIIQSLLDRDKALIYWDADQYYIENEREEAGHFIRQSRKRLKGSNEQLFDNRLRTEAKTIHIVSVPLNVGQAKALGEYLEVSTSDEKYAGTGSDAAIVLADEALLLPVLNAIPENAEINVTGGLPLHYTGLFSFFENIISLQENFVPDSYSFHQKDVLALLSHPFLKSGNEETLTPFVNEIRANYIYIPVAKFKECEASFIDLIFKPLKDSKSVAACFRDIIGELSARFPDLQGLKVFAEALDHLSSFFLSQNFQIGKGIFFRLFREHIRQKRIALTEEKEEALQLMGMLESRCLQFDKLFILNVNEGSLPAVRHDHSFIPYEVRKAYGLPVFDEQEALYAYNFYRLLQGAKEIWLFYNSETGAQAVEKSRYIRQIEEFLALENTNLKLRYHNYSLPMSSLPTAEIILPKDERYFAALKTRAGEKYLSPSFLSAYHVCALQFALKYVAGLEAPKLRGEELEANEFGTIFHELMQSLYGGFVGKTVQAEDIFQLKSQLAEKLNEVMDHLYRRQSEHIVKKNSLLVEAIKILAEKTLEADELYAPFEILALEEELKWRWPSEELGIAEFSIGGKVDRLDRKDGRIRVVDYKTGHLKKEYFDFKNEEELGLENKEAFQTIFYAWLYRKMNGAADVKPVLLPLRKINEGFRRVNSDYEFDEADFRLFEENLKGIIARIFDPEQPLQQVKDNTLCTNCDYKNICMR